MGTVTPETSAGYVGKAKSERVRARLKVLEPADLRLKQAPRYQNARRLVLATSWALVVGIPLLHARTLEHESAGLFDAGAVAHLPLPAAAATHVVGAPTSLALGPLDIIDPLAAFGVLLTNGASWALLGGMLLPLALVLLLGRFFCGWICPYTPIVAASNAVRALLARLGFRPRDTDLPRRSSLVALGVVLAASLVTGSQLGLLVYPPAVVGREVWRLVYFGGLGTGAAFLAVCFVIDTFYARAGTCRFLCPGGALFSLLGRWSPISIVRNRDTCTDCTLCDLVCNMLQSPMTDAVGSGCDRCARCVSVCPTKALHVGRRRR